MKKVKRLLFINIMIMISCLVVFLWVGCADSGGSGGSGDTPDTIIKLPDTGQTTCYDATGDILDPCPAPDNPGAQDGSYPRNPQSFTNNGDETITDNNTKLMWQREIANTDYSWSEAIAYCDGSSLAGYSDWRLPNVKEHRTIFNHEKPDIHDSFPTTNEYYWASNDYKQEQDSLWGWLVSPNYGGVGRNGKVRSYDVRCVRGGSESDIWLSDFSDVSNNVVSHGSTGLMWQKEVNTARTWADSLAYCEDSTSDSYDWRLPNILELQSIVDYDKSSSPAIDEGYFTGTEACYWSSTTALDGNAESAYYVSFADGRLTFKNKTLECDVRCVHGGQ